MSAMKDNRKVGRVRLHEPLKVLIGSIGADVRYDLLTSDISPNGFFLDFQAPGRFPFNHSSIMEIWLELAPGQKIFFNGKMARAVHPSSHPSVAPGIAVKIVQIRPDQEQILLDFIRAHHSEFDGSGDDDLAS